MEEGDPPGPDVSNVHAWTYLEQHAALLGEGQVIRHDGAHVLQDCGSHGGFCQAGQELQEVDPATVQSGLGAVTTTHPFSRMC